MKPENEIPVNDRREIFGWLMYDWANSAFYTTIVSALFGPYLTVLAQRAVGENGVVLELGSSLTVTAKSLYPFCVAVSVLLQVFLLPVLGAIADYTNLKKRLMAIFCYSGVVASCLLFFIEANLYLVGGLLFILANVSFGAAIVFYNAFLNDISTEDQRDKVSSRGFAVGYLGGGLLLSLNLIFVWGAGIIGVSTELAVRVSLLSAGIWWGGFSVITFFRLRTREPARLLPAGMSYLKVGFIELWRTFQELRKLPHTFRFLLAYLLYNDGIQTIISMSAVFVSQELFVARGLEVSQSFLLQLLLVTQFVALFGALLFERIAAWFRTKNAILISLSLWSVIVIYAYGFFDSVLEAWLIAGAIAIVLGGSQALSRSLFSQMIPYGREASFFGIYEVSERGTSWIGPLLFGIVVRETGSYRQAILSLVLFFVAGIAVLLFTNSDKAIHDAGNLLAEEAERSASPV